MKRKDYGRGSRRPCRVLLAGFFVLFLALLPLAAWPMQRAEIKEEPIEIEIPTVITEEPTAEEPLQNELSGIVSENISTEQSSLLTKAEEGRRLNGDESQELYFTLVEAREDGLGITVGTRIGNNLMAELGVDYTVGKFENGMTIKKFGLDNFEFRASVGWMF